MRRLNGGAPPLRPSGSAIGAPRSERLDAEVPDPSRHLEFAARQLSDPRVWPWHWPEGGESVPGPRTREQALDVVERQAGQCAEVGYCLWWWRERSSGELVGYVGLNRDVIRDDPVVEVGWSISPAFQRRGFATEAARASLGWGFEVAGLERIVSYTLPDNVASRGVMAAIGMRYVRDFERKGFPQVLYEIEAD